MNGRATDKIVGDLRDRDVLPIAVRREAADRLTELDASVTELIEIHGYLQTDLTVALTSNEALDALRPPCPTCDGTANLELRHGLQLMSCPDCVDGKVSIEQLAATWRAVWDDPMGIKPEGHMKCEPCALCVLEHLRAVRP